MPASAEYINAKNHWWPYNIPGTSTNSGGWQFVQGNELAKSASSSFIAVGHSAKFLRVVTYSDYRKVGTAMVPFRYDESMDGQQYWVVQLSDVQLNPVLDATYFQF